MNVLIVSGGDIEIDFLNKELEKQYDKIIAVDKGLESLYELKKDPDYIVGDFDSVDKEIIDVYMNKNIPIKKYDSEKDYTDTELGLDLAMSLHPKCITIIGAIGTRIDHTLANIHILTKCLENNIKCEMVNKYNKVYLINSKLEIQKDKLDKRYISIIPLTTKVEGITLKGFKYPLLDYTLEIGKSLGISNELVQEIGIIAVQKGILIVIESKE